MPDDGLGAVLQDACRVIALGQGNGDVGRQGRETSLLGQGCLGLLLLRKVAQIGGEDRRIGPLHATDGQFNGKLGAVGP